MAEKIKEETRVSKTRVPETTSNMKEHKKHTEEEETEEIKVAQRKKKLHKGRRNRRSNFGLLQPSQKPHGFVDLLGLI